MMKCFCPITGCENILPRTLPVRRLTRSLEKVRVEFTVILKKMSVVLLPYTGASQSIGWALLDRWGGTNRRTFSRFK